ncbi:hypothetical protein BH09PSE2_BH09PSE2_03400 [soil metagenome]
MKRIVLAVAALGVLAVPAAQAQAPAAPAASYEIVHAGDGQLSCEAVAHEVAALNADTVQQKAQAEQQRVAAAHSADTKRQMAGIGMGLLGRAAVMGMGRLPMGGLMSNPQLVSGLLNAANAGTQALAGGPAQAATVTPTGPTAQEQRAAYLMSLFKSKSC